VKVTLTFWRPQRRPTSEAECVQPSQEMCTQKEWIDVGGLMHQANAEGGGGTLPVECPQSAYENHPDLTLPGGERLPGLVDEASNRPANPANTLTYTLNLTQCLRVNGAEASFDQPPEEVGFSFGARALNSRDIAIQRVHFKRQ
jgi:hypothetical protein